MPRNNNFHFFASQQLQIMIEVAFFVAWVDGHKKCGTILAPQLTIKPKNIKLLVIAIARLHNFYINECLTSMKMNTSDCVHTIQCCI
jgi:hypothetical protein